MQVAIPLTWRVLTAGDRGLDSAHTGSLLEEQLLGQDQDASQASAPTRFRGPAEPSQLPSGTEMHERRQGARIALRGHSTARDRNGLLGFTQSSDVVEIPPTYESRGAEATLHALDTGNGPFVAVLEPFGCAVQHRTTSACAALRPRHRRRLLVAASRTGRSPVPADVRPRRGNFAAPLRTRPRRRGLGLSLAGRSLHRSSAGPGPRFILGQVPRFHPGGTPEVRP